MKITRDEILLIAGAIAIAYAIKKWMAPTPLPIDFSNAPLYANPLGEVFRPSGSEMILPKVVDIPGSYGTFPDETSQPLRYGDRDFLYM